MMKSLKCPRARRDLILVACAILAGALLPPVARIDELIHALKDGTGLRALDELPLSLFVVATALAWFAHRRWRDLQAEVTGRIRAEEALRESEARFRQLAENIREVFWITSADGQDVIYISPAYEETWGRARQSLYDRPLDWLEAVHPDDRGRVADAFFEMATTQEFDHEYRVVRPDGSVRWVHDRAFAVRNEQGELERIVGIAADMTERKLAEEELKALSETLADRVKERTQELSRLNDELHAEVAQRRRVAHALRRLTEELRVKNEELSVLALTDPLTGLHNRRYLAESLESECLRARRYGRTLSCLMIDVDEFKQWNDLLGHLAGDELLRRVAELIRDLSRTSDVVGRHGGDEFCVLLPETDPEGARRLAERIRGAVSSTHLLRQQRHGPVTISVGVYTASSNADLQPDAVLCGADAALRQAKAAGKNRVAVAANGLKPLTSTRDA